MYMRKYLKFLQSEVWSQKMELISDKLLSCVQRMSDGEGTTTLDDFEKKLMETDAYLQLLINQNMVGNRGVQV